MYGRTRCVSILYSLELYTKRVRTLETPFYVAAFIQNYISVRKPNLKSYTNYILCVYYITHDPHNHHIIPYNIRFYHKKITCMHTI